MTDFSALLAALSEAAELRAKLRDDARRAQNPDFAYFAHSQIAEAEAAEERAKQLLAAFVDERITLAVHVALANQPGSLTP